ncbi:hypothetical protein CVS30_05460 [Arthrobacter psychrolactophilus]|uniref:Uncharacterized protein n=1 Tax=Arthrobacter psychrolactophilus TaxID=92442 RepID=A0A2V5JMM8_9MICC|nr:hypothetical protein CVS30_05460 [Arthrobacter psychrolactophilus]
MSFRLGTVVHIGVEPARSVGCEASVNDAAPAAIQLRAGKLHAGTHPPGAKAALFLPLRSIVHQVPF